MAISKQYYVYLLTNRNNQVLYCGVTNNLVRRVYEHKQKLLPGFTKKYNVDKLVYFEVAESPEAAINREKQIKAGSRQKKLDLIALSNPTGQDLWQEIAAPSARNDGNFKSLRGA